MPLLNYGRRVIFKSYAEELIFTTWNFTELDDALWSTLLFVICVICLYVIYVV